MPRHISPKQATAPFAIAEERLAGLLDFLQAAEQLKDTLRSGSTRSGRSESTAEHCWRLALMCLVFERDLGPVDFGRLLKLALVHDLGEAISGDVPAPMQCSTDERTARERSDLTALCSALPEDVRTDILQIWEDYTGAKSLEARLVKAFDKLETMLQHQLMPPNDIIFHEFNLSYGRSRTDAFGLTRQIRDVVDDKTRAILERLANNRQTNDMKAAP